MKKHRDRTITGVLSIWHHQEAWSPTLLQTMLKFLCLDEITKVGKNAKTIYKKQCQNAVREIRLQFQKYGDNLH